MPDDFPSDNTFNAFPVIFVIVFVIVVGIIIVSAVMNTRNVVKAGRNPLTLQTDLELQVLNSAALAPAAAPVAASTDSVETRLAKLDDLHARKIISDDELAAARAKVLAE